MSIRSGASTPTINNIIFGNLTPRDTGTVVPCLENIAVKAKPTPTDFIEAFLKDDLQNQSTPIKADKEVERRKGKDLNKLKESKVKTQRKIIKRDINGRKEFTKLRHQKQNKRNRGYKDITRLKELLILENKNNSETSDSEMLDDEQSHQIMESIDNEEDFELEDVNGYETTDSVILESTEIHQTTEPIYNENNIDLEDENCYETSDSEMLETKEIHQIPESSHNKELINRTPKNIDDDLDISISNLLNFDDNQSVDFNISIASDFLKDDRREEDNDNDLKISEHLFKVPFSPPDNKYDIDKNLCKICDKTFKSKSALKIHFLRIHKQQLPKKKKIRTVVPKICSKCGKSFRDHSNFQKHMKKHEVSSFCHTFVSFFITKVVTKPYFNIIDLIQRNRGP